MPGRRKTWIAGRVLEIINSSPHKVVGSRLPKQPGAPPLSLEVHFQSGQRRSYDLYFWTVSQGGRSRSPEELRIQVKFSHGSQQLHRSLGTILLLGYFEPGSLIEHQETTLPDPIGEVFVAWDPLMHLHVGKSVSCQVKYQAIRSALVRGVDAYTRHTSLGLETVIAMKSEKLPAYMRLAAAGHNVVSPQALLRTFE